MIDQDALLVRKLIEDAKSKGIDVTLPQNRFTFWTKQGGNDYLHWSSAADADKLDFGQLARPLAPQEAIIFDADNEGKHTICRLTITISSIEQPITDQKRQPTTDDKRRAYDALSNDQKKELAEMRAFEGFVQAAKLKAENAKNEKPPLPDISCKIDGSRYLFELGEVTDQDVATNHSKSLRTGESMGGAFSEEEPLVRIIRKKTTSTYQTDGAPLDLLLHYDKQYPFAPGEYLERYQADIEAALIPNGAFARIWIYDSWTKSVLWQAQSK